MHIAFKSGEVVKRAGVDKAILPIGSIEQHGMHLPLATDSIIADALAEDISKEIECLVLPCIYYGLSQEHEPFFNISISNNTLINLITDISNSLAKQGIKKLFIINGHYGNHSLLESLPKMIESLSLYVLSYWIVIDKVGHADDIETSLMLAIEPNLVHMSKAEIGRVEIDPLVLNIITQLRGSFPKITENGVLGDPRDASKEKGLILREKISSRFIEIIKAIDSLL